MKILQINAIYGLASTGRTMKELSEAITMNGHISYCAYPIGKNVENSYIIGNKLDRKIHAFLSRITGFQASFSLISTLRLINFIKNVNPDVIHLRNMHSNYINFNLLLYFVSKNNIPLVLTLHDSWLYKAKNLDYSIDFSSIPPSLITKSDLSQLENKSWFFDRSKKVIRKRERIFNKIKNFYVVGVSKWITNEARKSFLGNANRIEHIYNWVDLTKFRPKNTDIIREDLGLLNKFIILGVSSYWSDTKGLQVFINLSKMVPDHHFIVLVGEVGDNVVLPKNVISLGSTNDTSKLAEYYSMADLFLNVSIAESFGKVSAESLACGTPVITNSFTANPEIVSDETGIIVDKFDYVNILDAVKEIESNGKDHYSKNCVERARQLYDKTQNTSKYIELYETIKRDREYD